MNIRNIFKKKVSIKKVNTQCLVCGEKVYYGPGTLPRGFNPCPKCGEHRTKEIPEEIV